MYAIEGKITTRTNPKALIGQYGLLYEGHTAHIEEQGSEVRNDNTISLIGTKWLVEKGATKLRKRGTIPQDLEVEHITSMEQAERFSTEKTKDLTIVKFRKPDLKTMLDDLALPDEEKLVKGFANLWKERRIPSPYVYCLAMGELLDRLEYSQKYGWAHRVREENGDEKQFSVKGNRVTKGIVTPIFFITKTHTNTETSTDIRSYR